MPVPPLELELLELGLTELEDELEELAGFAFDCDTDFGSVAPAADFGLAAPTPSADGDDEEDEDSDDEDIATGTV
ncbi:hypothetical protein AGMMS49593_06220 [Endomicrobiia bacterium]|nr:hypothetical protein AGMMS49593_06220 [Endomicrobiia bacterium]